LDQLSVSDKLGLEVENNQIILKPVLRTPRNGWDVAFQKMGAEGEDRLLFPEEVAEADFEWEW